MIEATTDPWEVQIVDGPLVALGVQQVVYSITLANGFVVTTPSGFGVQEAPAEGPRPLPSRSTAAARR